MPSIKIEGGEKTMTTSNGRGSLRPSGRSPPFLLIGLSVALCIIGFNYWSVSSRNSGLINENTILQRQVRETVAMKMTAEKEKDAFILRIRSCRDEKKNILNDKSVIENKCTQEKGDIVKSLEQAKRDLNNCETDKIACDNDRTGTNERVSQLEGLLQNEKDKNTQSEKKCDENACREQVGIVLNILTHSIGKEAVRGALMQNGINISSLTKYLEGNSDGLLKPNPVDQINQQTKQQDSNLNGFNVGQQDNQKPQMGEVTGQQQQGAGQMNQIGQQPGQETGQGAEQVPQPGQQAQGAGQMNQIGQQYGQEAGQVLQPGQQEQGAGQVNQIGQQPGQEAGQVPQPGQQERGAGQVNQIGQQPGQEARKLPQPGQQEQGAGQINQIGQHAGQGARQQEQGQQPEPGQQKQGAGQQEQGQQPKQRAGQVPQPGQQQQGAGQQEQGQQHGQEAGQVPQPGQEEQGGQKIGQKPELQVGQPEQGAGQMNQIGQQPGQGVGQVSQPGQKEQEAGQVNQTGQQIGQKLGMQVGQPEGAGQTRRPGQQEQGFGQMNQIGQQPGQLGSPKLEQADGQGSPKLRFVNNPELSDLNTNASSSKVNVASDDVEGKDKGSLVETTSNPEDGGDEKKKETAENEIIKQKDNSLDLKDHEIGATSSVIVETMDKSKPDFNLGNKEGMDPVDQINKPLQQKKDKKDYDYNMENDDLMIGNKALKDKANAVDLEGDSLEKLKEKLDQH